MAVPLEQVVVDTPPTKEDLHRYPWKYIGYKDFSAWTASDPDFLAVRRFDRLHTRAILTLQAQLTENEEKLDQMDQRFSSKNVGLSATQGLSVVELPVIDPQNEDKTLPFRHINNGTVRDDLPERQQLVSEIIGRLDQYEPANKMSPASAPVLSPPRRNYSYHIDNRQEIRPMAGKADLAILSSAPSAIEITARTHDVSQIHAHIATEQWLEDLSDAVRAAWPERFKRYSKVAVLMLSWENGNIGNNSTEFWRLKKVFSNEFNYEVHTWQIPLKRPGFQLTQRVQQFVEQYFGRDNLLIVYYAGHARRGDQPGSYPIWFASQEESVHAEADTASISSLLSEGDADAPDVLTLYDCCHPLCTLHGTSQSSNAVIESLCAGGFESVVPMPGPDSFTFALVDELSGVASSGRAMSRSSPSQLTFNGSFHPENQSEYATQDSPAVLLMVTVAEGEPSVRDDVRKWLLSSPPGVVEFKGFYRSFSTLMLVEMALEIWDLMPPDPAVTFAGFVNYAEPTTVPENEPTLLHNYLRNYRPQASDSEFLSLTTLRDQLQKDVDTIPSDDSYTDPDQESFAQLVSYANTISHQQLSEWKRDHFHRNPETSLPTSLFIQFCKPLVKAEFISSEMKKCLLVHQAFFSEYLSTRELIENMTASLQIQLRLQYRSFPRKGGDAAVTESRVQEELEDVGPSPPRLEHAGMADSTTQEVVKPSPPRLEDAGMSKSTTLEILEASPLGLEHQYFSNWRDANSWRNDSGNLSSDSSIDDLDRFVDLDEVEDFEEVGDLGEITATPQRPVSLIASAREESLRTNPGISLHGSPIVLHQPERRKRSRWSTVLNMDLSTVEIDLA
ncbi:hypothetical protein E8E14_012038 [Neopestalotiopsis sp. 37M]|nr:hypothetical protein E8E14_012038 [Neopestalotiopsis sp. 37M]